MSEITLAPEPCQPCCRQVVLHTLSLADRARETASSPGNSHTQAVSLLSPGTGFLTDQKSTNSEPDFCGAPGWTALSTDVVFPLCFCPTTYTYDSRASVNRYQALYVNDNMQRRSVRDVNCEAGKLWSGIPAFLELDNSDAVDHSPGA